MNSLIKAMALALLAIVLVAANTNGATARPAIGLSIPYAGTSNGIEQIRYRRHYGYYGHRRGRGVGIGIGAAVITGILLSEAARAEHRAQHSSAWHRCEANFRSFEPDTGYYTGYDGVRRPCPYLY